MNLYQAKKIFKPGMKVNVLSKKINKEVLDGGGVVEGVTMTKNGPVVSVNIDVSMARDIPNISDLSESGINSVRIAITNSLSSSPSTSASFGLSVLPEFLEIIE